MKLFKITTQDYTTQNNTLWGPNVTHTVTILGTKLCSNQVIHAYEDPRLAIIMNPAHAGYRNPILWDAEGEIVNSDGLKCGVKSLTTLTIISIPEISLITKISFGIYSALEVYKDSSFSKWAAEWLSGINRSQAAADYAAAAADYAANAAAADYAANAAAADYAAAAADYAADAAAANTKIDFISFINKAELVK